MKRRLKVLIIITLIMIFLLMTNLKFTEAWWPTDSSLNPIYYTCSDNQTILRISSLKNAHIGRWDSNYPIRICYNRIFRRNYNPPNQDELRVCSGDNDVINISGNKAIKTNDGRIISNAHFFSNITSLINNLQPDKYKICYGDLNCSIKRGSCNMDNGEREVLIFKRKNPNIEMYIMEDIINIPSSLLDTPFQERPLPERLLGHVNFFKDNEMEIERPPSLFIKYKLCCSSLSIPRCTSNVDCDNGEICDSGICIPSPPVTGGPFCGNDEECTEGHCCNDGICEPCPSGPGPGPGSECEIDANCPAGQICENGHCINYIWPTIRIERPARVDSDNPEDWPKFMKGCRINFEQISSASRRYNVIWNYGDGQVVTKENCHISTNNCNSTYTYSNAGQRIIEATAQEIKIDGSLGNSASNYTRILVYNPPSGQPTTPGTTVFAIITSPGYGEEIGQGLVTFNASASYVAKCGNTCPSGRNCYSVQGCVPINNPLEYQCYNLDKGTTLNYQLRFKWVFDEGTNHEETLEGTWNEDYNRVVEFTKVFPEGIHTAKLTVTYEGD
ncbi:MAG: hypothetical protein QXJ28_00440 [Candidatus Pacearchaeota archaeon]